MLPVINSSGTESISMLITVSADVGAPNLSVSPSSISLSSASTSETVTVSNVGDGTLSWTAVTNDVAVSVSPSSYTGNSKIVTISSNHFSESFDAQVTFTNDAEGGDTAIVTVSVTGGGGCGDCPTATFMLPGNVPLPMVGLPAGTFMMGSTNGHGVRSPMHSVAVRTVC